MLIFLFMTADRSKLDRIYDRLGVTIEALPKDSAARKMVEAYINASGAHPKIQNVFEVQRLEEIQNFAPFVAGRDTSSVWLPCSFFG